MASTHTYKSIMHYLSEMQCGHICNCQVSHITSSSARAQWPGGVTGPRFVLLDCVVGPHLLLWLWPYSLAQRALREREAM